MRIEKVEPSKRKEGRILVFLEDGALLKVTEQELLAFDLRAGEELDDAALAELRASAGSSGARAEAAAAVGRRAMSRSDLIRRLTERGTSERDAAGAADWLEEIGALNDADYAALLVRHFAMLGYGPARYRAELRKHGIDRELWENAVAQAPDQEELIERYLDGRLRCGTPDERELRRASNALLRRGFSWGEVKHALSLYRSDDFDD
jgi:regulatory protein